MDGIIGSYDNVQAVELVGVKDDKLGFAGVAFLELKEDSEENRKILVSLCKKNLPSFQFPKYFIFGKRDEWPQTSSLKIQKFKLKKWAAKILEDHPNQYEACYYFK